MKYTKYNTKNETECGCAKKKKKKPQGAQKKDTLVYIPGGIYHMHDFVILLCTDRIQNLMRVPPCVC